jgi:hypothetical protein
LHRALKERFDRDMSATPVETLLGTLEELRDAVRRFDERLAGATLAGRPASIVDPLRRELDGLRRRAERLTALGMEVRQAPVLELLGDLLTFEGQLDRALGRPS